MTKTKTAATPRRAKAKNSYELLERVCKAITARPLSYYQGMWSGKAKWYLSEKLAAKNECGTCFCRAGWIVAMNDGHRNIDVDTDEVALHGESVHIQSRACDLLGMDYDDAAVRDLFNERAVEGTPGTRDYARKGVSGLRAFMRQHAVHLKARSLKGV